jgi:hypothetical protein
MKNAGICRLRLGTLLNAGHGVGGEVADRINIHTEKKGDGRREKGAGRREKGGGRREEEEGRYQCFRCK